MDLYTTAKELLKRKYTELTKPGGALSFQYPENYVNPNDYDTELDVQKENAFKNWLNLKNKNRQRAGMSPDSGHDYDLRGYWEANVGIRPGVRQYLDSLDADRHGPDTFKKPNHPTFSTDSKYSSEKTPGGVWKNENGVTSFTPGQQNLRVRSKEQLKQYFKKREPDVLLNINSE